MPNPNQARRRLDAAIKVQKQIALICDILQTYSEIWRVEEANAHGADNCVGTREFAQKLNQIRVFVEDACAGLPGGHVYLCVAVTKLLLEGRDAFRTLIIALPFFIRIPYAHLHSDDDACLATQNVLRDRAEVVDALAGLVKWASWHAPARFVKSIAGAADVFGEAAREIYLECTAENFSGAFDCSEFSC